MPRGKKKAPPPRAKQVWRTYSSFGMSPMQLQEKMNQVEADGYDVLSVHERNTDWMIVARRKG